VDEKCIDHQVKIIGVNHEMYGIHLVTIVELSPIEDY
jgi:hypothetical protein